MPNNQEYASLAERCEGATGPDRELDAEIFAAVRPGPDWAHQSSSANRVWARHYTASLDAAMSLVDDCAVLVALGEMLHDGLPGARVGRPDLAGAPIFSGTAHGVMVRTPITTQLALALCAAALKARSQTVEDSRG